MSETLAIAEGPNSLSYVLPLILALGPDSVTCYCRPESLEQNDLVINKLHAGGFKLIPYHKLQDIPRHSFALADINAARRSQYPYKADKLICYIHATDTYAQPLQNSFMLYSSQRQFIYSMKCISIACDNHIGPVWGITHNGEEGIVTGLFHVGDWGIKKTRDKIQLKQDLASGLDIKFDNSKPLLAFFEPEHMIHKVTIKSLNRLAEKFNVVVKFLNFDKHDKFILNNIENSRTFYTFYDKEFGSYLLRFAADIVLTGCTSGVFVTNLILGLHTIPLYTQYMDILGRRGEYIPDDIISTWPDRTKQLLTARYENYIPFIASNKHPWLDILRHITPINIMSLDMIIDRIYDKEYWNLYDGQVTKIIRAVFGECNTEYAAENTAYYIKNALNFGTFKTRHLAQQKRTVMKKLSLFETLPLQLL